ncbi:MAG: DNA polymerase A family protein, partial [Nitrosopumilus sp.]
ESKLKTSLDVLSKVAGREVNPNSPKQVKELIYGDWKLPVQKSLSTKKTTTDDDALRALTRKFPHHGGGLKAILNCRQARKLISTYIDARLDEGYVRTSYGLTKTGRITSSKTIEGFGGNLQNIPRGEFRRLYIPDPGKVLLKADLSQAEYMVFCWEAPVPEFIHAYTTDPTFDVHLLNASRIFEIPMEAVTKERRYVTKQGVYAGNYRIGALKLSKMHDMAFSQAQKIIEGYKKSCPELEIWWAKVEDRIRTTRTLRNVFGRERIFFGRIDNALFRAAYDWICQSTVADIINQALVELDKLEVEVLLQVHDELVFQCEDDPIVIKDTVRKIKNAMEISLTFPGVDVPLVVPVEIAVGKNWFDVVEYKE